MIKKNSLLFLAGLVWSIAGYNVLNIGYQAYKENVSIILVALSVTIFLLFKNKIFGNMVEKHTKRITEYRNDKQWFWKFFDIKSFAIMAFMMSFGIIVRVNNLAPESFIAFFYTGLGSALLFSGLKFISNYLRINFVRYAH
ncbi:hypothetical protein E5347_07510 [Clostridium sartagoforme]|uniref:Uncharacterized protein n=1 Tax=Clostridium sartagoforme TaxID=84031 RepID=A0A4S2DLU3_9CLOT|nr:MULTISPECIES: hypothetical protein [Clostridium]MBS5938232.1 hypothetical protein [Clostridium sp.]TGY42652.1 hypothetical protein E5347_07510 [Clostridium sartagoforme]